MKTAFLKFISWMKILWHTVVRMFVKKKHIYVKDVDQDGISEIVLDPNGLNQISNNIDDVNKED